MQTPGSGPGSPSSAIFATLPVAANGRPGNLGIMGGTGKRWLCRTDTKQRIFGGSIMTSRERADHVAKSIFPAWQTSPDADPASKIAEAIHRAEDAQIAGRASRQW